MRKWCSYLVIRHLKNYAEVLSDVSFQKIICRSGVEINGRHHGSHCLRHSLATAMLADGSSIPVISESLGHRNSQSTMSYINVDIQSMRKCSLPVPSISDSFYMQKGGYFYD